MTTPSKNLEKAREMRVRIAKDARELKDARIALSDVLGNAEATLGNASIEYVLRHVPGLGVKGTRKVLREAEIIRRREQVGGISKRKYLPLWAMSAGELEKAEVQAIMRCLPPRVHKYQPKPTDTG